MKCYGVELEAHYCDIILQRWEDFTGKKAKKVKNCLLYTSDAADE